MKTVDYPPEITSSSSEETILYGEKLGALLRTGSVVALSGSLGAGKTCFAKGIARSLGIDNVTSPTYTIVSEYEGRIPLRHIDAYRLSGEDEFELMGGSELVVWEGITLVEWPEKIRSFLPGETLTVSITIRENNARTIQTTGALFEKAGKEG